MKEIVDRLHEKRNLEKAKSIMESEGYRVSRKDEDLRDEMRQRRADAHAKRLQRQGASKTDEIRNAEDPLEKAFELFVPPSGNSDNLGGEAVRAMMKIMYRDSNDGDLFYQGYGIETCGEAVAYLCDKYPELEQDFERIALNQKEGGQYTQALKNISEKLLDILYEQDAFSKPNTEDMFDWDGEGFIDEMGWKAMYEVELQIPDELIAHMDADNISMSDVIAEVEGWINNSPDADVTNSWGDCIYIQDLDYDDYFELEDHGEDWLSQYADELTNEYGDPNEEDEDEEVEESKKVRESKRNFRKPQPAKVRRMTEAKKKKGLGKGLADIPAPKKKSGQGIDKMIPNVTGAPDKSDQGTWDGQWNTYHEHVPQKQYIDNRDEEIRQGEHHFIGIVYAPVPGEYDKYAADIWDNSKADSVFPDYKEPEFDTEDQAKKFVEDWFDEHYRTNESKKVRKNFPELLRKHKSRVGAKLNEGKLEPDADGKIMLGDTIRSSKGAKDIDVSTLTEDNEGDVVWVFFADTKTNYDDEGNSQKEQANYLQRGTIKRVTVYAPDYWNKNTRVHVTVIMDDGRECFFGSERVIFDSDRIYDEENAQKIVDANNRNKGIDSAVDSMSADGLEERADLQQSTQTFNSPDYGEDAQITIGCSHNRGENQITLYCYVSPKGGGHVNQGSTIEIGYTYVNGKLKRHVGAFDMPMGRGWMENKRVQTVALDQFDRDVKLLKDVQANPEKYSTKDIMKQLHR